MNKTTLKVIRKIDLIGLAKELVKPTYLLIIKLIRYFPISSERVGSPKEFYSYTKKWIVANNLDKSKIQASYIEIYPSHQIERLKPKTIEQNIHWQFRLQSNYKFPNTFVAVVPGGRVWGDKGVVIAPDDKLLADVSIELGALNPEQANNHSVFRQLKLPSLLHLNKTVALLSVGGGRDIYFHWMFDLLPRIHLLRSSGISLESIDNFIINKVHLPFQKETLAILGIPPEKIIESSDRFHLKAKQLVLPSLPSEPAQIPEWVCEFIRKEFLLERGGNPINKWERIYISRNKAKHRRVLNEDKVLSFLEKLGFKNLVLESLSVTEQAKIFAEAKVVVAPHGGGLTNIVFCKPGTKVIEIFSPNYLSLSYWQISNHIGLDYYYLLGQGLAPKLPEDMSYYLQRKDFLADLQKDILINIKNLEKLMKLAEVI